MNLKLITHLNTQIPLLDASDHLPVVVELDIES